MTFIGPAKIVGGRADCESKQSRRSIKQKITYKWSTPTFAKTEGGQANCETKLRRFAIASTPPIHGLETKMQNRRYVGHLVGEPKADCFLGQIRDRLVVRLLDGLVGGLVEENPKVGKC